MKWKLIFLLSLFGLALSLLRVFGALNHTVEHSLWILIFLASPYVIAKNVQSKYFLHGFFVCVLDGIWNMLTHALLYDTLLRSNPGMREDYWLVFVIGPVFGVIFGIIEGLLTLFAGKLFKPKQIKTA